MVRSFQQKVVVGEALFDAVTRLPRPVVFTNGCFDILHRGHVTYLEQARALGGSLLVAVNTDASVRRLGKGADRPINSEQDRMAVLAALESISLVTLFDDDTPLNVVLQTHPDILVKGGDWPVERIVGSEEVLAWGGKVYSIPFEFQRSTSSVIDRIRTCS